MKTKTAGNGPENENAYDGKPLFADIGRNLRFLREILGNAPDMRIREFSVAFQNRKAALVYIESLVNTEAVSANILKPLMYDNRNVSAEIKRSFKSIEDIGNHLIAICTLAKTGTFGDAVDHVMAGDTLFLADGFDEALLIGAKKWERRAIEEPSTESVIRGPREGFNESLFDNVSMLRRRIRSPGLRFEPVKIGRRTRTQLYIAYMRGIANPVLIGELKRRLDRIDIDAVYDSGTIEAYIQDAPYSIFDTVGNSERPDTIASRLMEGRVAVLVDGSPFVLSVPKLFMENFQSAEDYYIKFYFASVVRLLRYFAFFITTLTPAIYVALTTFHQELIPSSLLFALVAGHENIPFPALAEALIMLVIFDILNEAGLRLPKPVGSAVSIVGALVLGQSAVTAGIVGPFMVIVVALTAVSSYTVASQANTALILRYFFVLLGGFLGGFGVTMGFVLVLVHMLSLRSFGIPYMSGLSPFHRGDFKDAVVRAPFWKSRLRPRSLQPLARERVGAETPAQAKNGGSAPEEEG